MKLTTQKDETLDNDYIDIKYRTLTPAIQQIFQICENASSILLCEKDQETYQVDVHDILYIEWVDNQSCVYTKGDVFTIPTALYQLEEALAPWCFIRVSKMTLVNIYKIDSIANGLNFRLTVKMANGEKVIVNRSYRSKLLTSINQLAKEV